MNNIRPVTDPAIAAEMLSSLQLLAIVRPAKIDCSGSNWIAGRFQRIAAAIAFLKSRAILVTPRDRDDLVRTYWVSGKREAKYAEEVIEIAIEKGWAE